MAVAIDVRPSNLQMTEVSFPLPHAIDTKVFLRIEKREKAMIVFVTTIQEAMPGVASGHMEAALGSFVYAIPNRHNPFNPGTSALYSVQSTIDMTIRLAKIISRKAGIPVYVSNSISMESTGMGGSPEEELAVFQKVLEVVTDKLKTIFVDTAKTTETTGDEVRSK